MMKASLREQKRRVYIWGHCHDDEGNSERTKKKSLSMGTLRGHCHDEHEKETIDAFTANEWRA